MPFSFAFPLIVLCSIYVHLKGLQSEKAHTKGSCSDPALLETPGFESSLYLCNLCASICNWCYLYTYTLKYASRHTVAAAVGYVILYHTTLISATLPLIAYILPVK